MVSLERFGKTAERVGGSLCNHARAHRVEVDILGHAEERLAAPFDDDGFELFRPKGAKTFVFLIEPDREPQF